MAFLTFSYVAGLLFFPEEVSNAVKSSLELCFSSVIPSLFPFLIASNLIINMKYFDFFGKTLSKIMPQCFSVSESLSPALILGFIGGYPIGGATVASVYNSGNCSKKDAEKALGFCNNCSPAFIIGTVGNAFFHSGKAGFFLFAIHIVSAIITGFIFKLFFTSTKTTEKAYTEFSHSIIVPSFSEGFTNAAASSLKSIFSVSSYIVFFSVFVCLFRESGLLSFMSTLFSEAFGIDAKIISSFFAGMFEMTSGIFSLPLTSNPSASFSLAAFFLGWGGFSVHFQTQSLLTDSSLDTKKYYIGKLLHGAVSLLLSIFIVSFIF